MHATRKTGGRTLAPQFFCLCRKSMWWADFRQSMWLVDFFGMLLGMVLLYAVFYSVAVTYADPDVWRGLVAYLCSMDPEPDEGQ